MKNVIKKVELIPYCLLNHIKIVLKPLNHHCDGVEESKQLALEKCWVET